MGWRVVAVLLAASDGAAVTAGGILRNHLVGYAPRIYRTGPHLVVVATVPAPSAASARAELAERVASGLTTGTEVADIWSGRDPLPLAA